LIAPVRGWSPILLAAALVTGPLAAQPQSDGVVPFRATYEILEGNKRIGRSTFTLSYDSATAQYQFESRSRFRGLLRLAAPRPIVERSHFVMTGGEIRPTTFTYEDGTRRGRRNVTLKFDWDTGMLAIERPDGSAAIRLEPGTLDRGSVRVALMRDLARDLGSGRHVLTDPDVIRAYNYTVESTEKIDTALGELMGRRVRQQRDGSSRHTLIWMAPSLDFLTLRMEQHRENRDTVAFVIETVEWLADDSAPSQNGQSSVD